MVVTRLFDILEHYHEIKPEQDIALSFKRKGEWTNYSLKAYVNQANYVSAGLLNLGVKKGDKIAIISSNRPEYNILDMGIMQIGAIPVPIYPTISESDYNYILNHAEITYIFLEGEELLRKIENVIPTLPSFKDIYTFKDRGSFKHFDQLLADGRSNLNLPKLDKIKASISPDDISCMIYTSGTTGNAKGVMLSHNNVVMQIENLKEIPSSWSDKAFSFLPLCHAYEKMLVYLYQYLGMSVYYAENLGTIGENIKEVHPTMMTCVPRLLEKIYDKLYAGGKKLPFLQRQLYYWAVGVAFDYKIDDRTKLYEAKHKLADKLIFSKWREAIGGNFDIVVSGGAAIQPRIAAFFSAIGMPVFEGYGLTETSPVIAVHSRKKFGRTAGTVGFPLKGVDVRIDEKTNEILCKGHNIMLGYYKEPELTKEAIDEDGYFHTGDTGRWSEHGHVIITGRLKSIFKTSMGKYVNPFLIEEKFCQSPFIENIMVVGENQKFAAALIVPSFLFLKSWCKSNKIDYTTDEAIIQHPKVISRINTEIKKYNNFFGASEKVKRHRLIADEWTVKNCLLTPTLKTKRNVAIKHYAEEIDKLFA